MSRVGTTTNDRAGSPRRRSGSSRRQVPQEQSAPVTPLGPRRRRRGARATLARRRRLVVGFCVAVLLLAVAGWVLLASPLLAVRTVQVDGAARLAAEEVVGVAGVEVGTPLARVDTDAAALRVGRLAQVASVEVTRGWPGTVVVTVQERVPVAVVRSDGARRLVDAGGVVFETITGSTPDGVVPLEVSAPGPDDDATRAALGAVTALPAAVRAELTGVAARTADDVTLTLTDGRTVRWGSADLTDRKAEVLGALLQQIDAGAIEPGALLDVSTPDAVVLR
ncbi:FtsQ-type POTRA domain-containing protein [Modestobacter muralis]|uniref:FtsQ-type POTRA domain-containing protein n=1 Tax=Modestobacter muralis TaxID=1608614 RepID=A0A6P0H4S8_9ACTN|nr:FtsQ-type POTRA domain-containing protein [Modestobacter muralis]NEN50757.1 FtsQ-type POTRA domain-containing protein [Modestobacter muralis]